VCSNAFPVHTTICVMLNASSAWLQYRPSRFHSQHLVVHPSCMKGERPCVDTDTESAYIAAMATVPSPWHILWCRKEQHSSITLYRGLLQPNLASYIMSLAACESCSRSGLRFIVWHPVQTQHFNKLNSLTSPLSEELIRSEMIVPETNRNTDSLTFELSL
jgi:hypothetical protein